MFDGKPFFCPVEQIQITMADDAAPDVAFRVHDYTPYFREWVTLKPALVSKKNSPSASEGNDSSEECIVAEVSEPEEAGESSGDEVAARAPLPAWDTLQLHDSEAKAMVVSHYDPNSIRDAREIDYEWTGREWQA